MSFQSRLKDSGSTKSVSNMVPVDEWVSDSLGYPVHRGLAGVPFRTLSSKEILKAKQHLLHCGTSPGSVLSSGSRPTTCLFWGSSARVLFTSL